MTRCRVARIFVIAFMVAGFKLVSASNHCKAPNNIEVELFLASPDSSSEVFLVVEKMPEFPGGIEALVSYINNNITYPVNAKQKGETGTVYVTFIVEKNGSVSNVEVARGVSEELDKEAIRITKTLPDWTPGSQRNKLVRVQFTLPIKFIL